MTPTTANRKGPARGQYIRSLIEAAAHMTTEFFGVSWRRIRRPDKSADTSRARRWACWWLHSQGLSLREVAHCVNRDHKAVERMVAKARGEDIDGRVSARRVCEIANSVNSS